MNHLLLGITGGIAAYKTPELVRQLKASHFEVRVVMSNNAQQFVTPLSLQTVSGHPVRNATFDAHSEAAMDHIELARWADMLLIAPATANCMAQLAHGLCPDLLSTLCLATTAPLILAPAMNQQMWQHPATQANSKLLLQRGVQFIGPDSGDQACGENGPGRMSQPETIVAELQSMQKLVC